MEMPVRTRPIGGSSPEVENPKARSEMLDESAGCLAELYPEDILTMDEDNFEIPYVDIKKVEIKKKRLRLTVISGVGTLKIERYGGQKKKSFEIAPNQDLEKCKNIVLNALNGKLVTK